ncbi:STAS domain-containing protein [Candidatus Poribacteria bacterium]|nr:STAS domain-containing protein [Candidatus Poribacteria bacterium]
MGNEAVIRLSGRLNHLTVSDLRSGLDRAIKEGAMTVVIDLTDVESIDAEAISILMEGKRRLGREGRDLKVVGAKPAIQRAFSRLGLSFGKENNNEA